MQRFIHLVALLSFDNYISLFWQGLFGITHSGAVISDLLGVFQPALWADELYSLQ